MIRFRRALGSNQSVLSDCQHVTGQVGTKFICALHPRIVVKKKSCENCTQSEELSIVADGIITDIAEKLREIMRLAIQTLLVKGRPLNRRPFCWVVPLLTPPIHTGIEEHECCWGRHYPYLRFFILVLHQLLVARCLFRQRHK